MNIGLKNFGLLHPMSEFWQGSDTPAVRPSRMVRATSVDVVKGLAILLMVFGHTEQGAMHRHLWNARPEVVHAIAFIDAFIYSFHMPAFFFAAGLFIAGSVKKRGTPGLILEKAKTVLYPYLLWAIISAILEPFTAPFQTYQHPFSWRSFLSGVVTGNSSWFLVTLFLCQILTLTLLKLPHWLQMSLAVTAYLLVPTSNVVVLYEPFAYLPFLIAGIWFSADRLQMLEQIPRSFAWAGFTVLIFGQLTTIYFVGPVTRWNKLPIGIAGITMLFFLAQALRQTRAASVLRWYGEGSLAIFLISPFSYGLGREFVVRVLHTTRPLPYLGLTTLIASSFPPIIWYYQRTLHSEWLFRWPESRKGGLKRTPASGSPIADDAKSVGSVMNRAE